MPQKCQRRREWKVPIESIVNATHNATDIFFLTSQPNSSSMQMLANIAGKTMEFLINLKLFLIKPDIRNQIHHLWIIFANTKINISSLLLDKKKR